MKSVPALILEGMNIHTILKQYPSLLWLAIPEKAQKFEDPTGSSQFRGSGVFHEIL